MKKSKPITKRTGAVISNQQPPPFDFLSHLLLVNKGCAVGLLGILCITRLDFYFGRVAVVALCMVMAGVNNALYTWQVLVFLFNPSLHQGIPPFLC